MISGISSSLSGLNAFARKLSVAADNVANIGTEAYKAKIPTIVEDKNALPEIRTTVDNNPGTLFQETDGTFLESSNVEIAREIPRMSLSQRGYEANLKALKTQDELIGTLLDMIG